MPRTTAKPVPAPALVVMFFNWSIIRLRASLGAARSQLPTWRSTSAGLATRPYSETTAISAGTNAQQA